MRVVWYLLALVLGLFGALALFRTVELLLVGAGVSPAQVLIALVGLLLAWLCVQKARSSRV